MKSLIVCLFTVCAFGQAAVTDSSPASGSFSGTYVIGAKDILYISVWTQPDLTSTLQVNTMGMIFMPLLNDVQAAGLTPMQMAASITEKLKKYIEDPHVTVVVTQMRGSGKWVSGDTPPAKTLQHRSPKIFMPLRVLPDLQDSPDGLIFPI